MEKSFLYPTIILIFTYNKLKQNNYGMFNMQRRN